jgi:hypothetical protein
MLIQTHRGGRRRGGGIRGGGAVGGVRGEEREMGGQ